MKYPLALAATFILSITTAPATVLAQKQVVPPIKPDIAEIELRHQLQDRRTAPNHYWIEGVAQCESKSNWSDGGRFAGGLGIFVGTWRAYGGLQFAPSPAKASVTQQLVVANRISVHGFQTRSHFLTLEDRLKNRPYYRPPVGFNGWGCIKNNRYLQLRNWLRNHPKR
jgi:hypothetical protein